MDSSQLLGISIFGYLLASAIYIGALLFRSKTTGMFGTLVTILTLVEQTAALGLRWYESYQIGAGHAPLTNMFESLVFFSWTIAAFYLL